MTADTWGKALYPALLIFVILTGGCLKQPPPLNYYTLSGAEQAAGSRQSFPHTVLVGPVRVASSLDRGQLVRQESTHSIMVSEQHRWAGRLPEMLTDILVSDLSGYLNSGQVYPFPVSSEPTGVQVEIHFLHFEGEASGQANVTARWKIISSTNQDILHTQTSTHRVPLEGRGYEELARGLSRGVNLLSGDIAEKLASIQPTPGS